MELLLFHVLMWGKTKNTIRIVTKSLRLVKSQELEEGALVIFEFHLKLNCVLSVVTFQWLDASVILPDESLELCRSVSQL